MAALPWLWFWLWGYNQNTLAGRPIFQPLIGIIGLGLPILISKWIILINFVLHTHNNCFPKQIISAKHLRMTLHLREVLEWRNLEVLAVYGWRCRLVLVRTKWICRYPKHSRKIVMNSRNHPKWTSSFLKIEETHFDMSIYSFIWVKCIFWWSRTTPSVIENLCWTQYFW